MPPSSKLRMLNLMASGMSRDERMGDRQVVLCLPLRTRDHCSDLAFHGGELSMTIPLPPPLRDRTSNGTWQ